MSPCNFDWVNLCCWRCNQDFKDEETMSFAEDNPDICCPKYRESMNGYDDHGASWGDDY